ncbi:MAG: DUF1893 domain-containing protein [Candidatus Oleimicrobiaceae bacterium]
MPTQFSKTPQPEQLAGTGLVWHSLEVYQGECLVFASDSKWLYPLFELERFLKAQGLEPASLLVHDKIVGRAAALLLVRLGIQQVAADLLSKMGQEVLERFHVRYEFRTLVERVFCKTEELLAGEFDPEKAYLVLAERAQAQKQSPSSP